MQTRLFTQSVWVALVIAATVFMSPRSSAQGQPNPASQVSKANLARAEVSVSSQQSGFPKAHVVDGNRSTEWASTGGHPWIALRWKEPLQVGRLVLCDRADPANRAQGGRVLFSDGSTLDVDDIPPGGAVRGSIRAEDGEVAAIGFVQRAWPEPRLGGN